MHLTSEHGEVVFCVLAILSSQKTSLLSKSQFQIVKYKLCLKKHYTNNFPSVHHIKSNIVMKTE